MVFDGDNRKKLGDTRSFAGTPHKNKKRETQDAYGYDEIAGIFQSSGSRKKENPRSGSDQKAREARIAAYQEYLAMRESAEEEAQAPPKGKQKKQKEKKKKKRGKRILIIFLILLLLIAAAAAVAGYMFLNDVFGKVGRVEIDQNQLGINPQAEENLKNYRNIALLGVDARDMSDYARGRTDAIIIVSLDKEKKKIRQISVFRDTYLYADKKHGYDKITNVHAYNGTQGTLRSLNENMDLNIKEVSIVNWKSVADTIDGIGGIQVDIQDSEINEMNKYIRDTQKNIGGSKKKIKKAGKQTLNGNQAVTYARIRKDSPKGDYRRNERMKIVLAAAMDKAKTLSPFKLNEIASKILPEIKTNMTSGDMFKLLWAFFTYKTGKQTGWPYDVASWIHYGVWYGPPVTLERNVSKLYKKYFGISGYTPTERVREISNEIEGRTGYH